MSLTYFPLCQMWHIGQQQNHAKTLPILSQFFNGAPVVFEFTQLLHQFVACCFNLIVLFYTCPPVSIALLLLLCWCYSFEKHAQSPSSFGNNHVNILLFSSPQEPVIRRFSGPEGSQKQISCHLEKATGPLFSVYSTFQMIGLLSFMWPSFFSCMLIYHNEK